MATITSKDGKLVSEQEQIEALIAMGMTPEHARFVVAFEARRISGDVVAVKAIKGIE